MPDIEIYDRDGNLRVYEGVEAVQIPTTDGGVAFFKTPLKLQNKRVVITRPEDASDFHYTGTISSDKGYDGIETLSYQVEPRLLRKSIDITENGTSEVKYDYSADTKYDGLSKVSINVNVPTDAKLQGKTIDITSNGTVEVTPDAGYDGLSKVDVTVNVKSGGSSVLIKGPAITFIDYDGTVVTKWAVSDLASKTQLPTPSSHDGLVFQGWNWTLENIKSLTQDAVVGPMYITDDGKTRIYIHLEEGRTSPMVGCCPNGTVTVDWGDGTTLDTLTGTSTTTVKWTPTHAYAAAGDYVVTLSGPGVVGISGDAYSVSYLLRCVSDADNRNYAYSNAIRKVELGNNITSIGDNAFSGCHSLSSISMPTAINRINSYAFKNCFHMVSISIPSNVKSISDSTFSSCYSLSSISIPSALANIDRSAFSGCHSLSFIPLPSDITSIGLTAFSGCDSLTSVSIPSGVTTINTGVFNNCYSLSDITIPSSLTSIGANAFKNCYAVKYYDFTAYTTIPTLVNIDAFSNIAEDCEVKVPAALLDEWKAKTNWSTYAKYIVAAE